MGPVKIGWCGHACVYLELENQYTVVIDPHDGVSIGLMKPGVKADLVLVTHDHFDHNAVNVVKKEDARVLKEFRGEADLGWIRVKGFKAYHDKYNGRRRGEVTVYVLEAEGKRIAHLGDIGEYPLREELEKGLENLDLLAIPVGGVYTIGPDEAWEIITRLQPRNILPIHYWVKGLILPLYRLDDFLVHVKKYRVVRLEDNEFELEDYDKSIIIPKPPTR